jgi:hypothetical protein
MKSRRMRWQDMEHKMKINVCIILVGRLEGRGHVEELDVDGKIILEFILGK